MPEINNRSRGLEVLKALWQGKCKLTQQLNVALHYRTLLFSKSILYSTTDSAAHHTRRTSSQDSKALQWRLLVLVPKLPTRCCSLHPP